MESLCAEDGGEDPLNLMADRVPMVVNTLNSELWFEDDGTVKVRKHSPRHPATTRRVRVRRGCRVPDVGRGLRKVFKTCPRPGGRDPPFRGVVRLHPPADPAPSGLDDAQGPGMATASHSCWASCRR